MYKEDAFYHKNFQSKWPITEELFKHISWKPSTLFFGIKHRSIPCIIKVCTREILQYQKLANQKLLYDKKVIDWILIGWFLPEKPPMYINHTLISPEIHCSVTTNQTLFLSEKPKLFHTGGPIFFWQIWNYTTKLLSHLYKDKTTYTWKSLIHFLTLAHTIVKLAPFVLKNIDMCIYSSAYTILTHYKKNMWIPTCLSLSCESVYVL